MASRRDHLAWARDAVAEHGLDSTAAHVLLVLATYANPDGWAWPGRPTLMADTGCSRPTVDRALMRLRAVGVVEHQPAAPGRPARYRLTMPKLHPALLNETHQRASSDGNVAHTRLIRDSHEAHQRAAEVEGEEEEVVDSPKPRVARSARLRTDNCIDENEIGLLDLAEHLRVVLQNGIDGLTTDEPRKRPTVEVILAALREHPVPRGVAEHVAVDVRSAVQAADRAPNVAAFFARRLADYENVLAGRAA